MIEACEQQGMAGTGWSQRVPDAADIDDDVDDVVNIDTSAKSSSGSLHKRADRTLLAKQATSPSRQSLEEGAADDDDEDDSG